MHKSQSLFLSDTALLVSGVTITHRQEHKTTVTTASGNRYTVLLSVAIVEELEPITHSNQLHIYICIYIYVCIYIHTHTHTHIHTHIHIHIHKHTYICINVYHYFFFCSFVANIY